MTKQTRIVSAILCLGAGFATCIAAAATVDLTNVPLVSGVTKVVPPNIYFILDDSGSMGNDYMPDSVGTNSARNCFDNFGYNTIYYNPAITYVTPKYPDGTSYPNATFTAAKQNGFSNSGSTTDLGATSTFSLTSNPYTITLGSSIVTVTHSGHGFTAGTTVNLSPARTFSGVTIGGDYNVVSTTNNSYTIVAANAAGTGFALGANPYTTANRSSNVTVSHAAHGFVAGSTVSFSPSVTFNGVTISGSYQIQSVTTNSYVIRASRNATATGTGGGSGITELSGSLTGGGSDITESRKLWGWFEYTASPTSPPATCAADNTYRFKAPTTTAEQTNYANWYSYYRTRILLMKSAAGRAFTAIDNNYRVGFSTISETGTNANKFLNLARFDATQKSAWYSKMYSATAANFTPLRGALSKAGRLYAGKLLTGDADPVQYSCQQNFTILTTDGYWNCNNESPVCSATGAGTYGPFREDNVTRVGDQDGVTGTARPYLDSGKYPDTLADIAMYYYNTDLRPTGSIGGLNDDGVRIDVSSNNVPTAANDTANWQHMTTFTLGLGVSGTLTYNENYLIGGSADYNAILQGTKNWPNPLTNPLSNSDTVTERIDDLWHAAVNGRGQYLSAANPDALVSALSKTLAAISVTNASAAAAATSSLEPVAGDNFAYVAQYNTGLWYGDLQARDIDLVTGALSQTVTWSARSLLSNKIQPAADTRNIYTFSSTATNKLKSFDSANLTAEKAAYYFRSNALNPNGQLTQYPTWTALQQAAATDDAMINFLRGQNSNEDEVGNTNRLFRDRSYALGDIVDSAPVFVKKPPFKYTDAGYTQFIANNVNRVGMVYVGANDGMLHAFDAATGAERWAYIPSAVIPMLYKLADAGYANNHQFYVNGQITVGDVYSGSTWKTILVGGLGRGGRAFYALDVTDPANPKALWEFGVNQDNDMGYSYGNPILTKRDSDNRWVVLVTSGYNNTASSGDGKGRLYVLDAFTGSKLEEIVTDESIVDPNLSGIAKITNYVLDTFTDNSTQYVYGGDLAGALWRFDITAGDNSGSSRRLGRTSATAGNQPITVRPEVARIRDTTGTYHRVVYFGTGRYLGLTDLAVTAPSSAIAQAVYAVKDKGIDLGVLTSTTAALTRQTLDTTVSPRTIPNPVAMDWSTKNGWYVNLPVGERMNVDPRLQLGTLAIIANVPDDDYCRVGGTSWLYSLDYKSGGAVAAQGTQAVGSPIGSSLATGLTMIRLPTNKLIAIVTQADTTVKAISVPVAPSATNQVRRVGWREIF